MTTSPQRTPSATALRPSSRRAARGEARERLTGYAFLLPAAAAMAAVVAVPLVYGITRSLFRIDLLSIDSTYVGLANFSAIFTENERFLGALWKGFIYAAGATILQTAGGLGMALLLHRTFRGRTVARGLILLPYVVPIVAATTVWRLLLDENSGLVNRTLTGLGITGRSIVWLGWDHTMATVIVIGSWKLFPFVAVVLLARLQTIRRSLYDAAAVDGASTWHQFRDVTLPALAPVLSVTIVLRFIWDFNDFDLIALLTGGGPARATETLPILIYGEAFNGHGPGSASALAVVGLAFLLVLFTVYYRLSMRPGAVDRR